MIHIISTYKIIILILVSLGIYMQGFDPEMAVALRNSGDLFLDEKHNIRGRLEYYFIGNDSSLFYVNGWSFIHFLSGFFLGLFLLTIRRKEYELNIYKRRRYYFEGLLIHSIWELWQIFIENTKFTTLRGIIDIFTDTSFFLIGYWIAEKIETQRVNLGS